MVDQLKGEIVAPNDKFKLVYIIFYWLGIGTLLPWNMFITVCILYLINPWVIFFQVWSVNWLNILKYLILKFQYLLVKLLLLQPQLNTTDISLYQTKIIPFHYPRRIQIFGHYQWCLIDITITLTSSVNQK